MQIIFNLLKWCDILVFIYVYVPDQLGFSDGSAVKNSLTNAGDEGSSLGWEDSLEKEMATHSSTLALKIPWMEELGAGYYPWGRKESGTIERLHFTSLPLQAHTKKK